MAIDGLYLVQDDGRSQKSINTWEPVGNAHSVLTVNSGQCQGNAQKTPNKTCPRVAKQPASSTHQGADELSVLPRVLDWDEA